VKASPFRRLGIAKFSLLFGFVLISEALKILFEQTLEGIDPVWPGLRTFSADYSQGVARIRCTNPDCKFRKDGLEHRGAPALGLRPFLLAQHQRHLGSVERKHYGVASATTGAMRLIG